MRGVVQDDAIAVMHGNHSGHCYTDDYKVIVTENSRNIRTSMRILGNLVLLER